MNIFICCREGSGRRSLGWRCKHPQCCDEREKQKRGTVSPRERKRRVSGPGEAFAAARRDHLTARQGQRHPTNDLLSQDAPSLPRR